MAERLHEIKVENIVASTTLARSLDLKEVAKVLKNAEYKPERFPGIVYKLDKPKTAMLIFRSGKVNCTGGRTIEDVRRAITVVTERLKKAGIKAYKDPKIQVQNIVAVYDLGSKINLNLIALTLNLENIEYEPEQFPGLVYRVYEPKIVMLLFGSGKVVCTGAKDKKDIAQGLEKLIKELHTAGLIR